MMRHCQTLIIELEHSIQDLSSEECPVLLGELERLKAMAWRKTVAGPANNSPGDCADLLTMTEAATRLSIPESRAYELARQGKLPAVRIGKYVRVSTRALAAYQAQLPKA